MVRRGEAGRQPYGAWADTPGLSVRQPSFWAVQDVAERGGGLTSCAFRAREIWRYFPPRLPMA